jgi:hypothetical protein
VAAFFAIHSAARSYHLRASSVRFSRQFTTARKNQSSQTSGRRLVNNPRRGGYTSYTSAHSLTERSSANGSVSSSTLSVKPAPAPSSPGSGAVVLATGGTSSFPAFGSST